MVQQLVINKKLKLSTTTTTTLFDSNIVAQDYTEYSAYLQNAIFTP